MATYVMSDIHGMYDMFMKMLDKIQLKNDDTLYILGDIIDRGPDSYLVYQEVLSHSNMIMLRGNHEQMLIDYVFRQDMNWLLNGCVQTMHSIQKEGQDLESTLMEMAFYFRELPLYIKLEMDRPYALVHAGVDFTLDLAHQRDDTLLWIREGFLEVDQYYEEGIILFGHTPNRAVWGKDDIMFGEYKIGLDGGACYRGQLNCLCLDDMRVFAVKKEDM